MIYLIDDNQKRQQDSGWSDDKFEVYKDFIYPIYRLSELNDNLRNALFRNENNVILFHESFFENLENKQDNDVNDIRNKLEKLSKTTPNRYYVTFSGSNSERNLNENNTAASIPVHILYNNLEVFIQQYQKSNQYNLKYLVFGANPDIEQFLIEVLNKSKRLFIEENLSLSNQLDDYFFFRSRLDVNPLNVNHTLIFNKDSQFGLNKIVNESLSTTKYLGIFVPLCFGSSLSDFNGLRLATEIRCTDTINQYTPIFIYSFVKMEYLLHNEYFNILKTKGIEMVEYSKKAFQFIASRRLTNLKNYELSKEIKKLAIQPPKNYLDSHSIINEWAIYQWAKTIGCDKTEELEKVFSNVNSNLYFKYLKTIRPIDKIDQISSKKLKIDYAGKPKVLLIDDEAEKGWYEIFAFLLGDLNNIYTDYLGVNFKFLSSDEIIEKSIDKIFTDYIDVVILDFRLNPSDFEKIKSDEITSIKLLKKLKKINPGIQVIIFSATNKVANLQALQEAQADGFVFKESSENSIDPDSTSKAIENFIFVLNNCFERIFLKDFYFKLEDLKNKLIPRKNFKKSVIPLPKDFVDETLKWFELSCEVLRRGASQSMITTSFIFMFSVLENLSNRVINVDVPIPIPSNANINQQLFLFEFRGSNQKLKRFQEDENNPGFYRRTNGHLKTTRNIPWKLKILNALDFITDSKMKEDELSVLIKKRNDLIHANSTTGDKFIINIELLINLNSIIYNGLINVK
jgi:CheY-like chemotaxis protein